MRSQMHANMQIVGIFTFCVPDGCFCNGRRASFDLPPSCYLRCLIKNIIPCIVCRLYQQSCQAKTEQEYRHTVERTIKKLHFTETWHISGPAYVASYLLSLCLDVNVYYLVFFTGWLWYPGTRWVFRTIPLP